MKPNQKVAGSQNVWLTPTMTGKSGSAQYKRGGMEFAIASMPEIFEGVIRPIAQKAYYRAWGVLGTIRAAAASFGRITDWVDLDLSPGYQGTDYILSLTDTKNGTKGALSIEYGRDPYYLEAPDGSTTKAGAMTGKFILHRGFNVSPDSLEGTGGGGF